MSMLWDITLMLIAGALAIPENRLDFLLMLGALYLGVSWWLNSRRQDS
jgi:hypothetical protein